MTSVGAILGLFLTMLGCICLFDRNAVWRWTEAGNRAWSRTSERTPEWDAVTRVCGTGYVLLGLVWIAQVLVGVL